VQDTSATQYLKFFGALCREIRRCGGKLVEAVNRINKRQVKNPSRVLNRKAVSLVKVPFVDGDCKVYARPFLTGNSYDLSAVRSSS
jgi:hypothetical protein